MNRVEFAVKDVDFDPESIKGIRDWLIEVVDSNDKRLKSLSYLFTNDEEVLAANIKHLDHDYYTDIITFNKNRFDFIDGEIYISVDRVRDNSNDEFETEILRVIVHGCLHLIGFNDHSDDEKVIMREEENKAIELYKNQFHGNVPRETNE